MALHDALLERSVIAEVALAEDVGRSNGWPVAFREAAVTVYNERAIGEGRGGIHSLPATGVEGHPGSHDEEATTLGSE